MHSIAVVTTLVLVNDIITSERFTGEFYEARDGWNYTLLDGHTVIRDIHDADTEELRRAGLIELTRMAKPRKRSSGDGTGDRRPPAETSRKTSLTVPNLVQEEIAVP